MTVTMKDGTGKALSTTGCAAVDPAVLTVAPDCSSVRAARIGAQQVRVTSGTQTAIATVRVTPQRRWSAAAGDTGLSAPHTIITMPDGTALSWGSNWRSVLGQGKADVNFISTLPAPVLDSSGAGPLRSVMQVFAGPDASVALQDDGTIWHWGSNSNRINSTDRTGIELLPVKAIGGPGYPFTNVVQVIAGDGNTGALLDDGRILGWGYYSGTNRPGTVSINPLPVLKEGTLWPLEGGVMLAPAFASTVALAVDGRVWVWGFNAGAARETQHVARALRTADGTELTGIRSIAAGFGHVLALTADGDVYAWGNNHNAELGQGVTSKVSLVAVLVLNSAGTGPLTNVTAIAASNAASFALDNNGSLWSWGLSAMASIGCGPASCGNYRLLPAPVVDESGAGQLTGIHSISASFDLALALKNDGTLLIWGTSYGGALGQGKEKVDGASSGRTPIPVQNAGNSGPFVIDPAFYPKRFMEMGQ